jgi:hypothetical protein
MAKPTIDVSKLQWAVNDIIDPVSLQANKIEPPTTKKNNGWVYQEEPPFNWHNYWMNLVYQYVDWIVTEPIEGDFTFTGVKTFDEAPNIPSIYVDSSDVVTTKVMKDYVIEIGSWDMSSGTGSSILQRVTSLVVADTQIVNIYAIIFNDGGTIQRPLDSGDPTTSANGGVDDITSSGGGTPTHTIELFRRVGSDFDSTDYDDTGVNRGFIHIKYFEK